MDGGRGGSLSCVPPQPPSSSPRSFGMLGLQVIVAEGDLFRREWLAATLVREFGVDRCGPGFEPDVLSGP
jgi:hypothetical protein